jgi:hypothetical protein
MSQRTSASVHINRTIYGMVLPVLEMIAFFVETNTLAGARQHCELGRVAGEVLQHG